MPERISESRPTARKAHVCQMCGGPIKVGETYSRDTLKYDVIYDWITCQPCETDGVCNEVHAWTGGYYDEGVGIEQADEWAHECADQTEEPGPMARRWLARNGCDCESCNDRKTAALRGEVSR